MTLYYILWEASDSKAAKFLDWDKLAKVGIKVPVYFRFLMKIYVSKFLSWAYCCVRRQKLSSPEKME